MIQSVDRALRILTSLGGGSGRWGVTELSEELGLAKGTVHGLLRTLQAHGLVEQHADSDRYQLGPALVHLGKRFLDLNELRSHALAWSELLATRVEEAVRVGTPHGAGMLVLHHVLRPDASLQTLEVGAIVPLHATALGKAVLASVDDDVRSELLGAKLPRLTAHTIVGRTAIRRELDAVRARRYAVEREEAVLGEAGVAAVVFDRRSEAIGAVGVSGPRDRLLRRGREREVATAVVEVARGISRDLGAPRWPAA